MLIDRDRSALSRRAVDARDSPAPRRRGLARAAGSRARAAGCERRRGPRNAGTAGGGQPRPSPQAERSVCADTARPARAQPAAQPVAPDYRRPLVPSSGTRSLRARGLPPALRRGNGRCGSQPFGHPLADLASVDAKDTLRRVMRWARSSSANCDGPWYRRPRSAAANASAFAL